MPPTQTSLCSLGRPPGTCACPSSPLPWTPRGHFSRPQKGETMQWYKDALDLVRVTFPTRIQQQSELHRLPHHLRVAQHPRHDGVLVPRRLGARPARGRTASPLPAAGLQYRLQVKNGHVTHFTMPNSQPESQSNSARTSRSTSNPPSGSSPLFPAPVSPAYSTARAAWWPQKLD